MDKTKYYQCNCLYKMQSRARTHAILVIGLYELLGFINYCNMQLSTKVFSSFRHKNLTTHTSLSPIWHGFVPGFVNYKKRCTRLTAASDQVYQLLAQGRWFSPTSSTTKTGRNDIAEILLKFKFIKHTHT
jgi:hypothetical protein